MVERIEIHLAGFFRVVVNSSKDVDRGHNRRVSQRAQPILPNWKARRPSKSRPMWGGRPFVWISWS